MSILLSSSRQLSRAMRQVRRRLASCRTVPKGMEAPELPGSTWTCGQRQDVSGAAGQGVSYLQGCGQHWCELRTWSHSGRFFSKICGFVTLVVTYLPRDEQGPRALLRGCFCSCSHLSEKAAGQWVETPLFARLMKDKLGSQNLNNIFKGLDCNLGIWEECGDRPTPCVPFSKLQLLLLQQSVL